MISNSWVLYLSDRWFLYLRSDICILCVISICYLQSLISSCMFARRWSSMTMTLRYLSTPTGLTTTTRSLRWTLWTKREQNPLTAALISDGTSCSTSPTGTVALRTPPECLETLGNPYTGILDVRCWHVVVYFVAHIKYFDACTKHFVARVKYFSARVKYFVVV